MSDVDNSAPTLPDKMNKAANTSVVALPERDICFGRDAFPWDSPQDKDLSYTDSFLQHDWEMQPRHWRLPCTQQKGDIACSGSQGGG
jgi:hypothetical protein